MAATKMPKLISLEAWAERIFGDAKPHKNTLYNWRRCGWIVPAPVKIGHRYFVEPSAIYADTEGEMARRSGNGG